MINPKILKKLDFSGPLRVKDDIVKVGDTVKVHPNDINYIKNGKNMGVCKVLEIFATSSHRNGDNTWFRVESKRSGTRNSYNIVEFYYDKP